MNAVREITQRLSLRQPLADSLALLAELIESGALPWRKDADLAEALAAVQARIPGFSGFERDFPSLCFALATGVGKTRLMAAIIALLYRTGRSRHFLVLAPNLTIYEKLKRDFDPGDKKYLFRGLPEFAVHPPLLVTGEDWDTGRAIRFEDAAPMTLPGQLFPQVAPVINLFNIAKINSRSPGADRKEQSRLRKAQECIGKSYFDYLAAQPDLVMLMDEAHRYRADAGARSIDELKPVLGIELTATPKTTGAKPKDFQNVAFRFSLGAALAAGYVKEPTVATRKDFDASGVPEDELQHIKLKDGVHVHEDVKLALEQYALATSGARKHPFMLVVARDTAHAGEIQDWIKSPDFFGGRYADKVIKIHSKTQGSESDENAARLLKIESDPSTEIVIHVDKLKEGWDVANLYTIVPLRASAAEILTEQTIGRGLRLPFGQRTGIKALDRLTIVAHDRFRDIIDRANQPDSLIRQQLTVGPGGDVDTEAKVPLVSVPTWRYSLGLHTQAPGTWDADAMALGQGAPGAAPRAMEAMEGEVLDRTLEAINQQGLRVQRAEDLIRPEHLAHIVRRVGADPAAAAMPVASADVQRVVEALIARSIAIPTIVLRPSGARQFRFLPFQLQGLERHRPQPVSGDILLRDLRTGDTELLSPAGQVRREAHPENYLVALLMVRDEIDYDSHAELLHGLAGQVVSHLRSYLPDEDAVHNVLQHQRRGLAEWIWLQLRNHLHEEPVEFKAQVTRGFAVLRARPLNSRDGQIHPFHEELPPGAAIRSLVFGGFRKCCFSLQKFDSKEGEFQLVRLLERDPIVLKWLKPAADQFVIEYDHGRRYYPDFVVETDAEKLIIELKREDWKDDPTVEAKARAAARWCHHASVAASESGDKPWHYLLIPHNAFGPQSTLAHLREQHRRAPDP